jgi:uncharacterized protein
MLQNLTPEELVKTIVSSFVEHPDDIVIRAIEADRITVFELHAHRSDTGRVIGKNGRTVRALREILLALQGLHKRRFALEIADGSGGLLAGQPRQDAAS